MAYLTRHMASKFWTIPRKGTKYIVSSSHEKKMGVPLLILLREGLGFVKTKRELKKVLLEKKILVNNKVAKEINLSLLLFDTLSLEEAKKYYRLTINENKKLSLIEIKKEEVNKKICKLVNKKILSGKKTQLNFNDGRNILTEEKIRVGDSAMINLDKKKIEKILPIKENAEILVIKGKHLGKEGKISKIGDEEMIVKSKSNEIRIKKGELIVLN